MTQMKLAQFRKHLAGLNSQHRKKIKGSADIESAEPFLLPTHKKTEGSRLHYLLNKLILNLLDFHFQSSVLVNPFLKSPTGLTYAGLSNPEPGKN
jgi:hypothetical protein